MIEISHDPYDRAVLEELAETSSRNRINQEQSGTIARGRQILKQIEDSYPTEKLSTEYFYNLDLILKTKEKRRQPGQVLLGLGTGRSGSTTLAALLGTTEDACCTHENPPLIFWQPHDAQLKFHMRRFDLLTKYFSLVGDVSHWWINTLDVFFRAFPDAKVIALLRETGATTRSFMNIQGYGDQSYNHWAPVRNGVWTAHSWDPTYPTYPVPTNSTNPDCLKYEMISRYVQEYNSRLIDLAKQLPKQVMLIRTNDLSEPSVQMELFKFAGVRGEVSRIRLNVRSVTDGISEKLKF